MWHFYFSKVSQTMQRISNSVGGWGKWLCWRTLECFSEDIFPSMNDKPAPLLRPFRRLSCSFAYAHTHTHFLLLLCGSQSWNALEKYERCYSHALGILSMHFPWYFISQGSHPVCFPAQWSRGVLERWNRNHFQSGAFTYCSYYCCGQETVRGPLVVLAQRFRNTENEWPIMSLDIVFS